MNITERELYASEIVLNLWEDEIQNLKTAFKVCKKDFPLNANREFIYLKMYILGCIYYEATRPVGNADVSIDDLHRLAQMHVDVLQKNVVDKLNSDGLGTYWGATELELDDALRKYPPMYQHVEADIISPIFIGRLDDTGNLAKIIEDNIELDQVFKGIVRNTYEDLYNKMEAYQNQNKPGFFAKLKYVLGRLGF